MQEYFTEALDMLKETIRDAGIAELVAYEGNGDQIEVFAVPIEPYCQLDVDNGIRTEHADLDWLIPREDLILAGAIADPEAGHTITRLRNGASTVFEVLPGGSGKPCFERSDPLGEIVRVHTKRIE